MDFHLNFPIRDLLHRAIAGDYTREQLAELHKVIYIVARRYVRMRCTNPTWNLKYPGIAAENL